VSVANAAGKSSSRTVFYMRPVSAPAVALSRRSVDGNGFPRAASVELRHHVLDLLVVLERIGAQVLAVAGLLVAAVRHLADERDVVIDPDGPERETLRRVQRPAHVPRPDRGRQAVVDVVGPLERLVVVGE